MKMKKWIGGNQVLEYWKTIENYEGLYMISSLGRVKSLERKVKRGNGFLNIKERILKPGFNNKGYLEVGLCKNGKRRHYKVHRLVALAFIPNPENKETVNHKNEIKTDNRVINLEWMTNYENCRYGSRDKRVGEASRKLWQKEEYRKKQIERMSGEKNPFFGKHHTEENKKILSKTIKEFWANMTEEERKGFNKKRSKAQCIPVIGVNIKTGEVLELYGAKQGKEFGFTPTSISACCKGKYKQHKGFKFYYKSDYEKLKEQDKTIEVNLNLLTDNTNINI